MGSAGQGSGAGSRRTSGIHGNVHIIGSSSGDNLFNGNANYGINIDVGATATLTIDAATTSGNGFNGVRTANGSKHVINKLKSEGGGGVEATPVPTCRTGHGVRR